VNFYGSPSQYNIIALLPTYLENKNSSLIYMVNKLIEKSENKHSEFYLDNYKKLKEKLLYLEEGDKKTILFGVSYALLNLIDFYKFKLKKTIIIETGGMKGKRKELIKSELHQMLKIGFGVKNINSEYGMTELISQAYSIHNEKFKSPPWMKIYIRESEDPMKIKTDNKSGGINIIDLANYNSCSFIATDDLGKLDKNGNFEILGRLDNSDQRGCNLLID
jgi:acyl-CoA synthetase (AMP-forming)/AMP-acid ligase II